MSLKLLNVRERDEMRERKGDERERELNMIDL